MRVQCRHDIDNGASPQKDNGIGLECSNGKIWIAIVINIEAARQRVAE
jgi:hypothetical protein